MLRDANAVPPLATLRADVCVVGGGAAGITVARDLRESGLTVVVLESGGLEHDGATQSLYEGTAGGDADVGLTACRERVLGGSTARWAGWCRPLDADDFEGRDWIPMSAWPSALRRDALARFY
ncbi:MAG TPA: FAD-dependent oxidoreductase, partial [Acidimicrobiia bacterium]